MKRELWSRLLRGALGTQFEDKDELFIEHTLLVNTAGLIAHLVLGLDVKKVPPATLVLGQLFEQAQIHGADPETDLLVYLPDHGFLLRLTGFQLAAEGRRVPRQPGQRAPLDDEHPRASPHHSDDRLSLLHHAPALAASRALKTVSASRMAATSWVRM
jgi:hypothetical protein